MRVRFVPKQAGYRLYVRFDPTVNGNGGGGPGNGGADSAVVDDSTGHSVLVAYDTNTATNAANRDYAQPVFAALDGALTEASSGFAGSASDGAVQLDASHELAPTYLDALGGNVVQTAQVAVGPDGRAVLALGFGATQTEAVGTAEASLNQPFNKALGSYKHGWERYDKSLNKPKTQKFAGLTSRERDRLENEYYTSANVIKASEDKTFPGAIVASLASPWGQAVSAGDPANTYFGSYREVFARDLYETWTGLVAAGDLATARAATLFLFERQQLPDGSMPRNSLVNGKPAPDSFGTQLDETAYPILMAQMLRMTDASLYANHIKPAANFLIAHGPVVRFRALGRAGWLLPVDHRRRDRRARRRGRPRPGQRRQVLGGCVAGRRRRLAALGEGVDRHVERAACRAPVLHPPLQDRRPQCSHHLQRRQRWPDARPALGDRRRVPRAGAARGAARERSGRPSVTSRGRCHDSVADGERTGVASLQRRRLRRPRRRRAAVGAERPGNRSRVACALRRARPSRHSPTEMLRAPRRCSRA